MQPFFPKHIANTSIALYFIVLIMVFGLFINHAMQLQFMLFGMLSVIVFFYYSRILSRKWLFKSVKSFSKQLFVSALLIRLVYVLFSYFYFIQVNGNPFEYAAGDSMGYHAEGEWIVDLVRAGVFWNVYPIYIDGKGAVSDMGYPLFLSIQYLLTDKSIFVARIIKALLSAFTCVFAYKLAARNFGEAVGRMAGIFMLLMPNLIMYCGMHLKETEMIFVFIAYAERTDFLLRSKKMNFTNIALPILLVGLLFLFRTVIGIAALFALATALLFSAQHVVKKGKRWIIAFWVGLTIAFFAGGTIAMEIETLWELKDTNQQVRLEDRARKGNALAKYGSAAVFAPMIFTIPFPTMVETPNQETFRMLHGGVFVKNIMSFFTLFALFILFVKKKWRENVFLIALLLAYLAILALSAFAHSERFHLPAVPLELILAAFGVSQLSKKYQGVLNFWYVVIFVAVIGWSFFKLKGRGAI